MFSKKHVVAVATACVVVASVGTASASPVVSGTGASKVVDKSFTTLASPTGEDPILRQGNSKFGLVHIKQGGKHGDKANHPYGAKAKKKWQQAFFNGVCAKIKNTYALYCHPYGRGKKKKTYCVYVDFADWKFNGKNMGQKGIVTAYWSKGQKGSKGRDTCLAKKDD
ncbi:hypothetical protein [Streptomyces venezuelae]|uniref:hypothetical protein n=1 Tax=Streptomyces venezuelae TaxID=54571 RepID=UPI003412E6C1